MIDTAEVARLRCRLHVVPLGPGPTPARVLELLADEPGLAALTGDWAFGDLVLSKPLVVADDPSVLDEQPAVVGSGGVGGGWVGWLGYDVRPWLAFYDHLLRYDATSASWSFEALWSEQRAEVLLERQRQLSTLLATADQATRRSWRIGEVSSPGQAIHLSAVERAIGLIRSGEIYQVNVCTRLSASFEGDPVALYAGASQQLRPAFGAYLSDGERAVVSLSPELFLRRSGRQVSTSPIKGTRPQDAAGARQLRGSAKDAAENVMIVDLMRNDLGRVCVPGSVRVQSLLEVVPHPGVWHLVSSIEGTLREDVGDAALIAATFAPGSVTGAPKVRARRAISELEATPRGVYTGAIGMATPTAGSQWNVAIRTFEIADGRIELGVGGGVTADSVLVLEWRECLQKAAPLFAAAGVRLAVPAPRASRAQLAGGLIETMLAVDGVVLRLADHLARLDLSCRELYGAPLPASARELVLAHAGRGRVALRLTLRPDLALDVQAWAAPVPPAGSELRTVRTREGIWRHKWADRRELTAFEAEGMPLFVDEAGTVLETSRGNVVLLGADGGLTTAPLDDTKLGGVTRRALLDLAADEHRRVSFGYFDVPAMFDAVPFWTSSLSGLVPITAVDGRPTPRAATELAALGARLGFAR